MDFIADIIEHDTETPIAPVPVETTGFPEVGKLKLKRVSRWKQRQQVETKQSTEKESTRPEIKSKDEPLSESEKIHQENLDRMSKMSPEEIQAEREELLNNLDPKLIQSLLKRTGQRLSEKKLDEHSHNHDTHSHDHNHDDHEHAEGYNGWIGAVRTTDGRLRDLSQLDKEDVNKALGIQGLSLDDLNDAEKVSGPNKKGVKFGEVTTIDYNDLEDNVELDPNGWEDVNDINEMIPNIQKNEEDEIAPDGYQLIDDDDQDEGTLGVHFTKAKSSNQDLDLNDPDFYDKLHEKYYPDLPKETEKLSWMTKPLPKQVSTTYESISDMRFDFKGDLIQLENEVQPEKEIPTYMGLHHHSDNPHLAGYTLAELGHLSRSVVPSQRCVSIQTLGRILHKLGLHKYSIIPIEENNNPEDEQFNESLKEVILSFESLMWDLIDELRIIDTIKEAADEKYTTNLSVRNYAIDALWLWKKGGGRPKGSQKSEEDKLLEQMT
ncbi:RPAP1-like protein [Scheffersomyces coipomensis]|uniref:RPAP1-like protein n=1 Tax=Scheffersomyces coipomensis TaxID=1788519 RepID=UPI00315DD81E